MNSVQRMSVWWLAVVGVLAFSTPLFAQPSPALRPFKASYAITWHSMSAGSADLELQSLGDGRWSYGSRSFARGMFRLAMPAELASRSTFAVRDDRIVPEQFISDDGASSKEKDQQLTFDWSRGRVTGVAEKKTVDLPTQPGLLDTMSVQVALMHELLAGRTPQRFVLIDKDRIKEYIYTTQGTETLRTAMGEHHTVIFRSSRPGSNNGTWFWCAPDLGYLPLKVERRDGKDVQWSMAVKSLAIDGVTR
ncbi:MAG: DUF3108 domain-containing protein [Steroidobacteraceae bacterium]